MALEDLVGRQGKPFEMVVERGKIAEFARATHAEDAAFYETAETVSPPTFLATTAHWSRNELALLDDVGDPRRRLHGEQAFEFYGPPPRAGARLRAVPTIEAAYERDGRRGGRLRFYVLATSFTDESDRLVAVARMTVVETERPPEAG
jgi:MaoC dehydratase-like protein